MKKIAKQKLLPLLLLLTLLASCSSQETQQTTTTQQPSQSTNQNTNNNNDTTGDGLAELDATSAATLFVDPMGNEIYLATVPSKIISTSAVNTEILIGLGMANNLVAVDNYSASLPGLPADIMVVDFQLPSVEALLEAECDFIFASTMNAAGGDDVFQQLLDSGVPVAYIPTAENLDDIYRDIRFLGLVCFQSTQAEVLIDEMQSRLDVITKTLEGVEPNSVYFDMGEGSTYGFGAGTYLDEAITLAGGVNIFAAQEGWFLISEEEIIQSNPDVIISNASYMDNAVEEIVSRDAWSDITAVAEGQVYVIDCDQSSRGSQNFIFALEEMAKAINPDLF